MGEIRIMKSRTNCRIKEKITDETGLVIVEAVIVFPVMFIVLFFIIFIGNMYYEQAKIDAIVLRNAIEGAERIAKPGLKDAKTSILSGTKLSTDSSSIHVEPYRYLPFVGKGGVIGNTETEISKKVREEINSSSLIFFANQKVNILGSDNENLATYKNYVLYSTFVVQVNYEIKFPIRFLGDSQPTIARLASRSEVSVSDCPEFIRNIDMVVDLLDGTGLADTITSIFQKINGFIEKFSE